MKTIISEQLTAFAKSKINNKHYSPKANLSICTNNKNILNNNLLILNPPVLHTYTKSNGNSSTNNTNSNNNNNNNIDNLKVAIRIRPPLKREIEKNLTFRPITIVDKENHSLSLEEYLGSELDESKILDELIKNRKMFQPHRFTFDEVFDIGTSQEEVFDVAAKPAVNSVLEGYNSTIFAYGQTGTGKTFTMEGFTYNNLDKCRGIIPRCIESIFSYIESNSNKDTKFIIRAAYLQIYNEMISDLLNPNNTNKNLNIREDKQKGLFVDNLSEFAVRSPSDIYTLLERGASFREVSNTFMNDVSSRSHAVFMITVEQLINSNVNIKKQVTKIGKLNLVDLAGSERTRVTGATGKQLQESKKINKSLSALGNVINALTDPKERKHIPYRDSKLTRLLEDSLGGNCKTTMIATISPAYSSFNESLSTLNFAKRAKNIKNRPVINEDIDHNGLIHQYESELKRIRKELEEKNKIIASTEELLKLKNREEKEKIDVIKAYEQTSRQLLIEREEKQKLEAKIEVMNLQMIKGGEKIEETPQFKSALQEKQILLQKDFEQRILKIEKEKEEIEDSKSQVEAYNKLLYQQRDIMNSLSVTLNEKEEMINNLQKANLELSNKILELNNVIKLKNNFIEEMEKILDNNKIKHQKYSKMNIEIPITNIPSYKKTYIPYEVEQNGKEYIGRALPLLTSEEKIKELNDIVKYKNKEIILLKKVSDKFLEKNSNMNDNEIKKKLNELQNENILLHHTINENNQMINLQRKENQSLEEHYNAIERIFQRTEKENLDLISIKEKIMGNLEQIIKKIDKGLYQIDNYNSQSIRTDLINIFQIILNNNINKLKEEKKNGGGGGTNSNIGGGDTNDNDITKIESNISINTNKSSSNNYPVKKLSSDTIKENKKYFKQNSLDDYDNYFKYHYNDRKIINNINNINNNNKSNQRNTNERNSNGVGLSHKNNINCIHDYKDSSGSDNFRTNRNKGENKINKKNPFEQPILNKDNNKRNNVTKNQKIKNAK